MNISNIPLTAVFGIGFSLFMLDNIGVSILLYGAVVSAIGLLIPYLIRDFGKARNVEEFEE